LGLSGYYRRFIPEFSRIARPLYSLLKKGVAYEWGPNQEDSFEKLKEMLTMEPILQYPDFTREFVLTSDASNEARVQSQGTIGKDKPIAFGAEH
jgi:hypothetical protein